MLQLIYMPDRDPLQNAIKARPNEFRQYSHTNHHHPLFCCAIFSRNSLSNKNCIRKNMLISQNKFPTPEAMHSKHKASSVLFAKVIITFLCETDVDDLRVGEFWPNFHNNVATFSAINMICCNKWTNLWP